MTICEGNDFSTTITTGDISKVTVTIDGATVPIADIKDNGDGTYKIKIDGADITPVGGLLKIQDNGNDLQSHTIIQC